MANKAGITFELGPAGSLDVISVKEPKPKMWQTILEHKPAIVDVLARYCFPSPTIEIITSTRQLQQALRKLHNESIVALDVETMARLQYAMDTRAALSTVRGQVRLVQLYTADLGAFVIDARRVDLRRLAEFFEWAQGPQLIGHNIAFDLSMLAAAGLPIPAGRRIYDTMIAANLIDSSAAGHFPPHALDDLVERYLGLYLPKTEQLSDWSADELKPEQISYAATDAAAAWAVAAHQGPILEKFDLGRVVELEMRALPSAVRLLVDGTPFDAAYWMPLAEQAARDFATVTAEILELLGPSYASINLRSAPQRMALLRARGHKPGKILWSHGEQEFLDSTDAETLRELRLISEDPLIELLQRWAALNTRVTRYGVSYPTDHVQPDGRLHGGYRAVGTATGRAICAQPNLLQIPREGPGSEYRRAFRPPASSGRVIVHADYSQIQLRIGADQANDRTLIAAYKQGMDVHKLTASRMFNKAVEDITDEQRQVGKTCGLALEFGMGPDKLRATLMRGGHLVSQDEAKRLHGVYHRTYRGLHDWQRSFSDGVIELRTLTGRRRTGVWGFSEKPNSRAQQYEVDGMKTALAILADRWDAVMPPTAKLVLLVYDEIDIEADAADADQVALVLKTIMEQGMRPFLERVPVVVDTNVWPSWGGKDD